jgi:hypothetical protein
LNDPELACVTDRDAATLATIGSGDRRVGTPFLTRRPSPVWRRPASRRLYLGAVHRCWLRNGKVLALPAYRKKIQAFEAMEPR